MRTLDRSFHRVPMAGVGSIFRVRRFRAGESVCPDINGFQKVGVLEFALVAVPPIARV